jgi:hypothetical protein
MAALTTSPGLFALPSGMFSEVGTKPCTSTSGSNPASAWNAPRTAAPPDISYFISSIRAEGLMLVPPESKVSPLPTRQILRRAFPEGL